MRKLKFRLDRRCLEVIYFSYLRPVLEYAVIVWDNCTEYEKNELQKIQNEAGRIVCGATKLVSISDLHNELCWSTLSERRLNHKLCLFYKMNNSMVPEYLSSLTPASVSSRNYSLRNSSYTNSNV